MVSGTAVTSKATTALRPLDTSTQPGLAATTRLSARNISNAAAACATNRYPQEAALLDNANDAASPNEAHRKSMDSAHAARQYRIIVPALGTTRHVLDKSATVSESSDAARNATAWTANKVVPVMRTSATRPGPTADA